MVVSIFLGGLLNKDLHSALYMKHRKQLYLCIHEAIDYDTNCDWGKNDTNSKTSGSSRQMASQIEDIIKGVTKKIQQLYGSPRATNRRIGWPYICGVRDKNHPTSQCIPKKQVGTSPDAQLALWCYFHKKWENHLTRHCYNKIQHM